MILDTLTNSNRYGSVHPLFAQAFEALHNAHTLPPGTHTIDGDNLFIIIAEQQSEPAQNIRLEAHRKYIDIQTALDGSFDIGWRALEQCRILYSDYDTSNDVVLFDDRPDFFAALRPGMMAILFPDDAHAPMPPVGSVRKAVVKVRV
jgi:biofilm protein TabA